MIVEEKSMLTIVRNFYIAGPNTYSNIYLIEKLTINFNNCYFFNTRSLKSGHKSDGKMHKTVISQSFAEKMNG